MTRSVQSVSHAVTGLRQALTSAGPVGKHTLQQAGSAGPETKKLQALLIERGFLKGPASGTFDAATTAAVKGFQQARGLQVDGLVGQQTWGAFNGEKFPPGVNLLQPLKAKGGQPGRSAYVPPRQNDGPAIGRVALPPTVRGANGDAIAATAAQYVGLHERHGNANPFSTALGRPPEKWCADFVSYCARQNGAHLNTASAQGVQNYLTSKGTWKGRSNPAPGDAITFDWAGRNGHADHVGIVEKVFQRGGKFYVQTVEGNSSDQVKRNTYSIDDPRIKGFGAIV